MSTLQFVHSPATNWINNAALNGSETQAGPGGISPPVRISFHKLGPQVTSSEPTPQASALSSDVHWGFFDQTTNVPIVFPDLSSQSNQPLVLRLRLFSGIWNTPMIDAFNWHVPVRVGGTVSLQTSTNLVNWGAVCTVTNLGGVVEWYHTGVWQRSRFFRVVPE